MNLYNLVLFLHIAGALGLFAALGLEWTGLRHLRRAPLEETLQPWLAVFGAPRGLGPASLGILVLTGFYLTWALRPPMAWVIVALGGLVALGAIGGALTGRHMARIHREFADRTGDELASRLRELVRNPQLSVSLQLRTAIAGGIVFLMTTKPGWLGSLLVMGAAVTLALITGPLLWRRSSATQPPAKVS